MQPTQATPQNSRLPLLATFRARLLLLVLLLVSPAVALLIHSDFEQRRIEKDRARAGIQALCELEAANQANFVKNARQMLATLSEIPLLTESSDADAVSTHLANLCRLLPDYANFGLIETNGMVFATALPMPEPIDASHRSYFQGALRNRDFAVGEYQVGRLTERPGLNFGYPVLDDAGTVTRVVYAALDLDLLTDVTVKANLPPGAVINVVDRNGAILARNFESEKWVGQTLPSAPLVQAILSEKNPVFEMKGIDGVARLYARCPVGDHQDPSLFVSVGIPVKESFAGASALLLRNLTILIVMTLVVTGAGWLYAKRFILRPVEAVVGAARRISEGDLRARAGLSSGSGELADLARDFDRMADMLEKRQLDLEKSSEEVRCLNSQLEQRVRDRTQLLETANRELEAFTYSVSHDLRAPLRHINGFVNLLRKEGGPRSEEELRFLGIISDSATHMGHLIDDLLGYSRMARRPLSETNVNLTQLIEEVRQQLQPETDNRAIEWKIGPLPSVRADAAMLRQVMVHLLSNAVKYTRPRNPAVIEVGATTDPDAVTVFVRDNGVGFDMQFVDKLFGVFQRLHAQEPFEGTGIGLATVHRIIQRHGGSVRAEGAVDGGATFYFTLPAPRVNRP